MKKLITLFAIAGMVLALVPAAQAAPGDLITGVTATASSEGSGWQSRLAIDAVNGNGITSGELATGMHNRTAGDSWEASAPLPQWFRVDLGAVKDVGTMYVWNGFTSSTRAVRVMDIYYSTVDTAQAIPTGGASSGDWTFWGTPADLPEPAAGNPFGPTVAIDLSISARVIGFDIRNLQTGNPNNASFAELQFAEGTGGGGGSTPGSLIYGK
jgi:hypothetical protein